METVIYLLLVCLVIFIIFSLLPIILPIVLVIVILVTILLLYARYKVKKNISRFDDMQNTYQEHTYESFDNSSTSRSDDIIDVEYTETQEDK